MKNMQRENTNEEQLGSHTFTIIVDDDVATYLEQEKITDTNAYMNELLQAERARRNQGGNDNIQNLGDLLESTPDTSGYPQMQEHFETPSS